MWCICQTLLGEEPWHPKAVPRRNFVVLDDARHRQFLFKHASKTVFLRWYSDISEVDCQALHKKAILSSCCDTVILSISQTKQWWYSVFVEFPLAGSFMVCRVSLHSIFSAWLTETAEWRERPATLWDYQTPEDGRAGSFLATKRNRMTAKINFLYISSIFLHPPGSCVSAPSKGAVLENVMGFLKVLPKVLELLAENLPQ